MRMQLNKGLNDKLEKTNSNASSAVTTTATSKVDMVSK